MSDKRPFEISKEIYPYASKWIEIDGIKIHYLDEGKGDVLLLCHGNPSWSLLYVPMIQILSKNYRCIAMDYPGFGMSGKPKWPDYPYTPDAHSDILNKFIDSLSLDKFSIFVQDWGGPIGLSAAVKHADKIDKMFIGNTWAWYFEEGTPMGDASRGFSSKMGGDDMLDKIKSKNSFLKISLPLLLRGVRRHQPELSDQVKEAYLAPFADEQSRIPTWVFPKSIIASVDFLRNLAKQFDVLASKPTILFWGMKDVVFPPIILDEWKQKLTNYRVVELPNASHFFQTEEADLIAKEIIEFKS